VATSRRELRLALLLALVPLVLLLVKAWEVQQFSARQVGFWFEVVDEVLTVTDVVPGMPAAEAGIEPGDELAFLQGHTLDAETDLDEALADRGPDGSLHFIILRAGREVDVDLIPGAPFPFITFGVTAFTVLCYLLIGPLAISKRPGYLRARLLHLLTAAVAIELALPGEHTALVPWFMVGLMLNGFQMGVELHLASVIPERQRWLDRHRWAIKTFYALGLGLAGLVVLDLGIETAGYPPPVDTLALVSSYSKTVQPLWAFAVLFLLGRQALEYPEPGGRRQAGIVALGVLPWAALVVASSIDPLWSRVPLQWEEAIWNVGLLGYPLAVLLILWHEASNQERILLDLTVDVQGVTSISEISRIVSTELHSAFHPKCTHVFYRRRHTRDLTLGHSTVASLEEEIIPEESALLRLVEAVGRAVDYPEEVGGLPPEEREWLERLEPRLLVPVASRQSILLGLLVLGRKKSEEPYTPHDRKLLQALAGQIALIYENARLTERVDQSQRIQREVLSRLDAEELALVRECPTCGRCFSVHPTRCPDDGSALQPSIPVEQLVAGRYRLERIIDRGGMGAIYEATDDHLGRRVAVKVLVGAFVNEELVRRFDVEARLTASLRHPNIITVHDYGTTNTGSPFLVLELLHGTTLSAAIATEGAQSPSRLATWLDQACDAMRMAHAAGIIHRDLKPANLFLAAGADEVTVKILDFGVAKFRRAALAASTALTAPGALIGTFRYMAPEQLSGERADERSDIFALGVVVIEAINGRHPFPGESPAKVLAAIESSPVTIDGDAHLAATTVLRRAVAFAADDRFQTIEELQAAAVPALRSLAPRSVSAADGSR